MDFYQQLQLSSIGSKQWIKGAKDSKEKYKRILIYNFKVYLVVAFCFALVTLYSMISVSYTHLDVYKRQLVSST